MEDWTSEIRFQPEARQDGWFSNGLGYVEQVGTSGKIWDVLILMNDGPCKTAG